MAVYVVFKSHGNGGMEEPANEVFFHQHLDEALIFRSYKEAETNEEWEVAEVFPKDSWVSKLFTWLAMRSQ